MTNNVSFELLDYNGKTTDHGEMPWYYVQPRIIKYECRTYVLLSDVIAPGPDTPHRYVMINDNSIYQPTALELPEV